ncbi:MAG: LysR family transcriptional regulator [Armatimonadota bacterium]|nr:LysR family transcriptional regulator [Armatimonadota bacterium]MDR7487151.1 LysR family transcriptional regulator [Armatimonadota bacterium]
MPALTLNLNKLWTFEAVARLGSFTAAARELHISQPAVTVQVRELEAYFGVTLIQRGRRGALLTPDGEVLYGYARQVVTAALAAQQAVAGARELAGGTLPLVATPTAASYVLPAVLRAFTARYPGVHLQLLVLNSRDALASLADLRVDLGVMPGEMSDARLVTVPFFEDRLVLAVHPGHRLAGHRSIAVRQLQGERMIFRERGSGTRALIEAELRRAGVRVRPVMELASNEATLEAVAAGQGVALVSAEMARRAVETGRLAAVDVRDVRLRRTFWFVFRRDRAHYPTIRAFIQTGQSVMRSTRGLARPATPPDS